MERRKPRHASKRCNVLHFYQPHLVSVDSYLKAGLYKNDSRAKVDFDNLTLSVAKILGAIDIVVFEDWYHDYAFYSDKDLSVEIIRQKMRDKNLPFYEINPKS